ncbi:MAG: penicillin-binding protein 2 [Elusimicrobia bacterium RIFCSPLOWO2_01_FULL_60_11]|nr:MAG: penicillin-binding protein 2 [Elusimicrobia bacterium RIFCSPLOWO2_01_FULL_60_11]
MKSEMEGRLRVILALFVGSFAVLAARLFYLQVIQGEKLRTVAEANRTQIVFERAPRGLILDRNSAVLADNRPTFVVIFTPLNLKREILAEVIRRLSKILGLSEEELAKRLKPAIRHSSMVRLMDRASRHIAFALAEQKPNLPGVSVVIEMQRRYPQNGLAAHVLGFLGQVSQEEKGGGYRPNALVGKMGLEKNYDKVLRGEDGGMRLEVDASGRSLKILDSEEPSVGYEIRTTLDLKVQQAAEEGLKECGKSGAVVAMDPRNGDILAIASAPGFDPNAFVYIRGEENAEDYSAGSLLIDPEEPLFNRAIQGRYPPGSIFKIIDTVVALESKKVDILETNYCPGYYRLSGAVPKTFLCWKKEGHRSVALLDGLVNSCNVYFYKLGLKLGPDAIESLARQFGLGSRTGIEIKGEDEGLIPGRGMFKTNKRSWYDGDTLNMAIGQGTILFTPLQAAQMASVVASRGKVYRPHLVKEVRYPTGEIFSRAKTELMREVRLTPGTWDFMDQAMTQVVERGTGQSCKIPGVAVGGKTGTAQNPHGKDHAWFVAFAPVENPTIAVSVLIEHGVHGATAAAPIARKVLLAALPAAGTASAANMAKPSVSGEFSGD